MNDLLFLFVFTPTITGISIGIVKLAELTAERFPKIAHYFEVGINIATAVFILLMTWPYVLYRIFKELPRKKSLS